MQTFDPGYVIHETEGITVGVEGTAIEARPRRHAGAYEVLFESGVAPLAVGVVDRIVATMAGIELSQQLGDDGLLVLLHQIPQHHINRHRSEERRVGKECRSRWCAERL